MNKLSGWGIMGSLLMLVLALISLWYILGIHECNIVYIAILGVMLELLIILYREKPFRSKT